MQNRDVYCHLIVNENYFLPWTEQSLALYLSGMWVEKITDCFILSCLSKMVHKVLKWDGLTIRRALAAAVVPCPESFPTDQLVTKNACEHFWGAHGIKEILLGKPTLQRLWSRSELSHEMGAVVGMRGLLSERRRGQPVLSCTDAVVLRWYPYSTCSSWLGRVSVLCG